jgi:hypothetical protein
MEWRAWSSSRMASGRSPGSRDRARCGQLRRQPAASRYTSRVVGQSLPWRRRHRHRGRVALRNRPALRTGRRRPRHPRFARVALQWCGPDQPTGRTLRRRTVSWLVIALRYPAAAVRRERRARLGRNRHVRDPALGDDAGEPGRRLGTAARSPAPRGAFPPGPGPHGVLASQGGAVIDPGGRVLDADGQPIPGLYAGWRHCLRSRRAVL